MALRPRAPRRARQHRAIAGLSEEERVAGPAHRHCSCASRAREATDNRWAVWVQGVSRCRVEKAQLRNIAVDTMREQGAVSRIIPDGEAFSHFGGTSAFPECWSAALLEDEAFSRVEFLPPPESADVAPVCQFDVAAATAWDGAGLDGIYAAPLSVDADARNAADAADGALLAERERDVWLKLDELLRRPSERLADRGAASLNLKF